MSGTRYDPPRSSKRPAFLQPHHQQYLHQGKGSIGYYRQMNVQFVPNVPRITFLAYRPIQRLPHMPERNKLNRANHPTTRPPLHHILSPTLTLQTVIMSIATFV